MFANSRAGKAAEEGMDKDRRQYMSEVVILHGKYGIM